MMLLEMAGWLGAGLTLGAYSMRSMMPLRIVAIGANVSFIAYGALTPVYPMLVLHVCLLPLNVYRLSEILKGVRRLKDVRVALDPISVLKPYFEVVDMPDGAVLFSEGDPPDKVYYLDTGSVLLPEVGLTLSEGELFGEMAFFSASRVRTTSAICRGPCQLRTLDDATFMRLFHQHPEFSVSVVRLIAERLVSGSRRNPDAYASFVMATRAESD